MDSADSKMVLAVSKMVLANSKIVSADSKTVLAVLAVVLVSPLTLYRPSETVLIHFVLKLIFPEYKKTKKFITQKVLVQEPSSFHQKVYNYLKQLPHKFQPKTHTYPGSPLPGPPRPGPPRHFVLKLIFPKIKKALKNS